MRNLQASCRGRFAGQFPSMSDRFEEAVRRIDALNAEDPTRIEVDGRAKPRELANADWLSEWVLRLEPDASEALRLAARAQHLTRWKFPRSDFEPGRTGYRLWRRAAMDFHSGEASRILAEVGYDTSTIEAVQTIVRKHGIPEARRRADDGRRALPFFSGARARGIRRQASRGQGRSHPQGNLEKDEPARASGSPRARPIPARAPATANRPGGRRVGQVGTGA